MSSEKIVRVRAILVQVLSKPPGERSRYLEGCCPDEEIRKEVERLLGLEQEASAFLATSLPERLGLRASTSAAPLSSTTRLSNRYIIESALSEGGFASVYLARD